MTPKLQIQEVTNHHDWDLVPITHWQHSWEYGALQEQLGRVASRFAMYKNGMLVGFFQTITYPLWGEHTLTYLPYGPVWITTPSNRDCRKLQSMLAKYGDARGSIFVRIESSQPIATMTRTPGYAYRTSFHQPRGEAVLDISPSMDTLLSACSKSTRRNIKKSLGNHLSFEVHHGSAMCDHVDEYIALNTENTHSHGTTTHSEEYFTALFTTLSNNKNNFLAIVRDGADAVAINVFTVFGSRAYCPFGASNTRGKDLGAYYHIKWKSIEHLQELGVGEFNWGGIAIGQHDDNLANLNQFKLGWNTIEKHHGIFHDVVLSPLYWLYLLRSWFVSLRKS